MQILQTMQNETHKPHCPTIFISKCVCHLVGCFPPPMFCSHPHLCETRVTSLKLFCLRYFHYSVHEFLISSLYVLHFSTSLIPFRETFSQSCFNCTGDSHILLFQWEKKCPSLILSMFNLQLHFGVRCFSWFFLAKRERSFQTISSGRPSSAVHLREG